VEIGATVTRVDEAASPESCHEHVGFCWTLEVSLPVRSEHFVEDPDMVRDCTSDMFVRRRGQRSRRPVAFSARKNSGGLFDK
jgi:hypothetical protein